MRVCIATTWARSSAARSIPTFNLMLRLSTGLKLPLSEIYALYEQRRHEYKPVRLRGPGKST